MNRWTQTVTRLSDMQTLLSEKGPAAGLLLSSAPRRGQRTDDCTAGRENLLSREQVGPPFPPVRLRKLLDAASPARETQTRPASPRRPGRSPGPRGLVVTPRATNQPHRAAP